MADRTQELAALDHAHVWHPFTAMQPWRDAEPLIIDSAQGAYLIDTRGKRYIDGVSSLWCNVHGHRVGAIDRAVRDQLDRVAHTTLLGLASPPSIELAAQLVARAPRRRVIRSQESGGRSQESGGRGQESVGGKLNKVFYSDAGATALEVAFKMAVGYWFHTGRPNKHKFIGIRGAYHGDTVGAMSIGYSELFHRPFASMVFDTRWAPAPDNARADTFLQTASVRPQVSLWPSEDAALCEAVKNHCLSGLETLLQQHADETAAIVIEPIMQGAAGMICQPRGYLRRVAELARRYDVLLIADEVATGFGRTGAMFACEHEGVEPDLLCLAKGITGGYLPLAATLASDAVEQAFCGELSDNRTLYHGHTYTGNALACAAALASLKLFDETNLLAHIAQSSTIISNRLGVLRDHPHILDIRQRGLMVGIELCQSRRLGEPLDFSKRTGAALCLAMREKGLFVRPLGDVIVLMPIPAMDHDTLHKMLDIVVETVLSFEPIRDGAC